MLNLRMPSEGDSEFYAKFRSSKGELLPKKRKDPPQTDPDLEFYRNFRKDTPQDLARRNVNQQHLNPDSAEFRALTTQYAQEKRREIDKTRAREQIFKISTPETVAKVTKEKKTPFAKELDILEWYKKLNTESVLSYDQFNVVKQKAEREGKLIRMQDEMDLDGKPDRLQLQQSSPERYYAQTTTQEGEIYNVHLQSSFGVDKEQRNKLKVGDQEMMTELQVVWFVSKDTASPKALRYVLADDGEWYKSTATSFSHDRNQNIDFWNLGEYEKMDKEQIDTVTNEMSLLFQPQQEIAKAA